MFFMFVLWGSFFFSFFFYIDLGYEKLEHTSVLGMGRGWGVGGGANIIRNVLDV